ncbi:MAG TPA: hypothetical protein DD827_10990, partial [Gammaproteobacteria bacterium]|nr:hypothetical protein [Gammaproteobacteria bacterium]
QELFLGIGSAKESVLRPKRMFVTQG